MGIHFKCKTCIDYILCFKCYRSKSTVHPYHEFDEVDNDIDYDDPIVSKVESERPKSTAGEAIADSDDDEEGGQFDDEIVGDDMTDHS